MKSHLDVLDMTSLTKMKESLKDENDTSVHHIMCQTGNMESVLSNQASSSFFTDTYKD